MKTLTYEYDKMVRAVQIIDALPFYGTKNARLVSELADILDSGQIGEIIEKEETNHGVHAEEVCEDKLEK